MTDSGFQLAQLQAAAYEAQSGRFMGPSARLIIESMRLKAGDVMLDLACGTGLIARQAHPLVRPGGRVVGADVNQAMMAAAASLAGGGIEWVRAPAENLPFDDATFTHVACQQGFQFFPDALAAAHEAHRVLKTRGTLTATIWATPGHNPYIETQLELLAALDDTITASARAATPTDADELLRDIATEAGFHAIDLSLLEHSIEVDDLRSFFLDQTATTPWAPVIGRLSPSEQNQLADEFVARLSRREMADRDRLSFCSHMIRCQR